MSSYQWFVSENRGNYEGPKIQEIIKQATNDSDGRTLSQQKEGYRKKLDTPYDGMDVVIKKDGGKPVIELSNNSKTERISPEKAIALRLEMRPV